MFQASFSLWWLLASSIPCLVAASSPSLPPSSPGLLPGSPAHSRNCQPAPPPTTCPVSVTCTALRPSPPYRQELCHPSLSERSGQTQPGCRGAQMTRCIASHAEASSGSALNPGLFPSLLASSSLPPGWGLPQGLFPSLRLTDALGREGVLQICRICQHLLLQTPDHTHFFWPASSCQNSTHSFISACRKGRGVPTASLCQRLPLHYPRYHFSSTLLDIRVPWRACWTPPQTS